MTDEPNAVEPLRRAAEELLAAVRTDQAKAESRRLMNDEFHAALTKWAEASHAASRATEELARTVRALKGDEQ